MTSRTIQTLQAALDELRDLRESVGMELEVAERHVRALRMSQNRIINMTTSLEADLKLAYDAAEAEADRAVRNLRGVRVEMVGGNSPWPDPPPAPPLDEYEKKATEWPKAAEPMDPPPPPPAPENQTVIRRGW